MARLLLFSTQLLKYSLSPEENVVLQSPDNGRIDETITLITAFVGIISDPRKNKTALSS